MYLLAAKTILISAWTISPRSTSGKQHGVKIHDLLCSDEFEFNAPFRIVEVGDIIEGSDVELTVVYNSESDEDIPEDILDKWICAINDNDEGGVDIEYSA